MNEKLKKFLKEKIDPDSWGRFKCIIKDGKIIISRGIFDLYLKNDTELSYPIELNHVSSIQVEDELCFIKYQQLEENKEPEDAIYVVHCDALDHIVIDSGAWWEK